MVVLAASALTSPLAGQGSRPGFGISSLLTRIRPGKSDCTKTELWWAAVLPNSAIFDAAMSLYIGQTATGILGLDGWIDELRITKGVARYANGSRYTPATAAFPQS